PPPPTPKADTPPQGHPPRLTRRIPTYVDFVVTIPRRRIRPYVEFVGRFNVGQQTHNAVPEFDTARIGIMVGMAHDLNVRPECETWQDKFTGFPHDGRHALSFGVHLVGGSFD